MSAGFSFPQPWLVLVTWLLVRYVGFLQVFLPELVFAGACPVRRQWARETIVGVCTKAGIRWTTLATNVCPVEATYKVDLFLSMA